MSSAKSRTCECMFSGRLLIYSKNNKGPSIEPWGTPELTGISDELSPSSLRAPSEKGLYPGQSIVSYTMLVKFVQ